MTGVQTCALPIYIVQLSAAVELHIPADIPSPEDPSRAREEGMEGDGHNDNDNNDTATVGNSET